MKFNNASLTLWPNYKQNKSFKESDYRGSFFYDENFCKRFEKFELMVEFFSFIGDTDVGWFNKPMTDRLRVDQYYVKSRLSVSASWFNNYHSSSLNGLS